MITLTATDTLIRNKESRQFDIYNFGTDNRYPNDSAIFAENAPSLKRCVNLMSAFLFGKGMDADNSFWKRKINIYGLRVDQLLRNVSKQYSIHQGFAWQIVYGYSSTAEIVIKQVIPIPFEQCRLEKDDDFEVIKHIKVYRDWSASRITKDDIKIFDVYNPNPKVIARQIELAGGIDNWNGQILYYGENGELKYPYCYFHASREDAVSDIKIKQGRNADVSTNMLASHIIQLPFTWKQYADSAGKSVDDVKAAFVEDLQKYQGAENTGKLMALENNIKDSEGKMVEFKITKLETADYDKAHEHAETAIKESIRGLYMIPPILLDPVSTGFSTEIMESAYKFYNNITSTYRGLLEEIFMDVFSKFEGQINPSNNYSITPLNYI